MWLMLQQAEPEDYVIATGETHSVREYVQEACKVAGIADWESVIAHDVKFDRPAEVDLLIGNSQKAQTKLGWRPKTTFTDLVRIMVEAELEAEK